MYDYIAFVDFDGTVTTEDTLAGALRMLVSDEEYRARKAELMAGRVTLSAVLRDAFERSPSSRIDDFVAYARAVPLRPGFGDFLDRMEAIGVPVVVLSGGLRPMLEARLAGFEHRLAATHCVGVDLSGPLLRLVSPFDDGTELLSKAAVMRLYDYRTSICVGDSLSDLGMAAASDLVFARDYLAEHLSRTGKRFTPWNDFFGISASIERAVEAQLRHG